MGEIDGEGQVYRVLQGFDSQAGCKRTRPGSAEECRCGLLEWRMLDTARRVCGSGIGQELGPASARACVGPVPASQSYPCSCETGPLGAQSALPLRTYGERRGVRSLRFT